MSVCAQQTTVKSLFCARHCVRYQGCTDTFTRFSVSQGLTLRLGRKRDGEQFTCNMLSAIEEAENRGDCMIREIEIRSTWRLSEDLIQKVN